MAFLPEPLADEVRGFAASIPDGALFIDPDGGKGREDEPHATIKYGIHTSDPREVAQAVAKCLPPLITLGGVSAFHGDKDFVVLKIRAQSVGLTAANKLVSRLLECTDSYPDYKPHITVAYLKKSTGNPYYYRRFFTDAFEGKEFVADEFVFSTPGKRKFSIPVGGSPDASAMAGEVVDMAEAMIGG